MTTVAILDNKGRLTGYRQKRKAAVNDVVVPDSCDLPTDGSYFWDGAAFFPLGHGAGKVQGQPPVSDARVLHMIVRAMPDLPAEAHAWADWFEANILSRERDAEDYRRIVKGR